MKPIQRVADANIELRRAHKLQSMRKQEINWSTGIGEHTASVQDSLGDVLAASVSTTPNNSGKFEWEVSNGYLDKQGSSDTIEKAKQASESILTGGIKVASAKTAGAQWVLDTDTSKTSLVFLEYQGEQFGYYDSNPVPGKGYYWCVYNPDNDYVEVVGEGYSTTDEEARQMVMSGGTRTSSKKKESMQITAMTLDGPWNVTIEGLQTTATIDGTKYECTVDNDNYWMVREPGGAHVGEGQSDGQGAAMVDVEMFLQGFTKKEAMQITDEEYRAVLARRKQASNKTSAWIDDARSMLSGGSVYDTGIDLHTASMLVQIYDKLGDEARAKFEAMPLERAVDIGWKLVNKMSSKKQASKKTSARKTTRFVFCDAHQSYFSGDTKRRQAENFVEGGPTYGGPCQPELCKVFPGTDFYSESSLDEVANISSTWAVNRDRTSKKTFTLSNRELAQIIALRKQAGAKGGRYGDFFSNECLPGGSGSCDGYIPDDEEFGDGECSCYCHQGDAIEDGYSYDFDGIKAWHEDELFESNQQEVNNNNGGY